MLNAVNEFKFIPLMFDFGCETLCLFDGGIAEEVVAMNIVAVYPVWKILDTVK